MDEREFRDLHATNPLCNEMETMLKWDILTENHLESTIADMFSEFMSDYPQFGTNRRSNSCCRTTRLVASFPDSTNLVDSAENTTQINTWPLLEVTDCSLEEWPTSNNKPLCETNTAEGDALRYSNVTTPVATPSTTMIPRNPSRSHASTASIDRNPFLNQYTQQGEPSTVPNKPNENQSTQIEDVFRTPPLKKPEHLPTKCRTIKLHT